MNAKVLDLDELIMVTRVSLDLWAVFAGVPGAEGAAAFCRDHFRGVRYFMGSLGININK